MQMLLGCIQLAFSDNIYEFTVHCSPSYLQPASRFLFELFALAELADLMAGFAVATAAALFAVNPAPARCTQAASLPLFLPIGTEGR